MTNIVVNNTVHVYPANRLSKAEKLATKRNGLSTPAYFQYVSFTPVAFDNDKVLFHVFSKKFKKSVSITGNDIWYAQTLIDEGLDK